MPLRVFTFSPDWGLPTVGPFALKLLAWLELAGIVPAQAGTQWALGTIPGSPLGRDLCITPD